MTTATSIDGGLFQYACTAEDVLFPGTFVSMIDSDGHQRIGIVEELQHAEDGGLVGAGRVLGSIEEDGRFNGSRFGAFFESDLSEADAESVEQVYESAGATLSVGSLVESQQIGARLIPSRFNRHTFWCGQSGSGKTYALGVVLEQLLVHTALPMVIFDPNADFVRLSEMRSQSDGADHSALRDRDIRVLRPGRSAAHPLLVRFTKFSMRSKAAILRLDPVADREEFSALMHLDGDDAPDHPDIVTLLRSSTEPAARSLATRVENLRLMDWDVWAFDGTDVNVVLDERPDATVLDLGGFEYPDEHLVVALSVLDDLWSKRGARQPILIVIDEAHNLCSPDNDSPLHRAVRERIIQIAAEGRKYGLWLLLSTQRPSKVHPSIISQCDNLALLRMSSPSDLEELAAVFGFAPRSMLARSPRFQQGEALFAGGFVPAPTLLRVSERLTHEGGSDVKVPLRAQPLAT